MSHHLLALLLLCAGFSTLGLGASEGETAAATGVQAQQAWARATRASGTVGAAYLTIHNPLADAQAVVGASSERCGRIELHTHILDGEVMRMVEIDEIPLPATADTLLKPGGLHLMLFDLTSPLAVGDTFTITITLASGVELSQEVRVGGATARSYEEAVAASPSTETSETTSTEACCPP